MHNVPRQEFASEPVPVLHLKRHFNRRPIRFRFRHNSNDIHNDFVVLSFEYWAVCFIRASLVIRGVVPAKSSSVEWYLQNQGRLSASERANALCALAQVVLRFPIPMQILAHYQWGRGYGSRRQRIIITKTTFNNSTGRGGRTPLPALPAAIDTESPGPQRPLVPLPHENSSPVSANPTVCNLPRLQRQRLSIAKHRLHRPL